MAVLLLRKYSVFNNMLNTSFYHQALILGQGPPCPEPHASNSSPH